MIWALDRFQLLYDWGVDKRLLARNPNLTPEQIDLLQGLDLTYELKKNLARYPKLTEEQFMRFFNDKDSEDAEWSLDLVKIHLTQNPNLTTEQIDLSLIHI